MSQLEVIREILATAAGEIGYQSHLDPKPGSKYGRWAAEVSGQKWLAGPSRVVAWCDLFVCWVYSQAGQGEAVGVEAQKIYAYTVTHRDWLATHAKLVPVSEAQPGDIVFFDWDFTRGDPVQHVGIVERNLGSGILQTIEGNTSRGTAGSQGHGGGVWRRTRKAGIRDVYRPELKEKNREIKNEGEKMYLICENNQNWWLLQDGKIPTQITSWDTVQAFLGLGLHRIDLSTDEMRQIQQIQQTICRAETLTSNRVKDIKDILTDYPEMPNSLKNVSLIRKIAGKLGVEARKK